MNNLAGIYYLQGKYVQAEVLLNQTLEIKRRVSGSENPDTLLTLSNLGSTFEREGKYALAETSGTELLTACRHVLGPGDPNTSDAAADLGLAYLSQRKFVGAEPLSREAAEFDRRKRPDHWQRFHSESLLGASLAGQKKYTDAEPLLLEGYEGMSSCKDRILADGIAAPEWQYHLARTREWIVRLYEAWGKPEKAAEWKLK
jgi:Flp pilus assembly protein TadD